MHQRVGHVFSDTVACKLICEKTLLVFCRTSSQCLSPQIFIWEDHYGETENRLPCLLRYGLRVRSANIQLGDDAALSGLFKENRGNYYFVGEVFAVSKALIPNSQRNYFNENEARVLFEDELRSYFYDGSFFVPCEFAFH